VPLCFSAEGLDVTHAAQGHNKMSVGNIACANQPNTQTALTKFESPAACSAALGLTEIDCAALRTVCTVTVAGSSSSIEKQNGEI